LPLGLLPAGMMFSESARADVVTYDATLASLDANPATNVVNISTNNASWYNGQAIPKGVGLWTTPRELK